MRERTSIEKKLADFRAIEGGARENLDMIELAEAEGEAGLAADFIATSEGWGVAKPEAAFFTKVIEAAGIDPHHIAYVGDRVDNDVVPARAAGMHPILIRRGPWGRAQWHWPESSQARHKIESLHELASLLEGPTPR